MCMSPFSCGVTAVFLMGVVLFVTVLTGNMSTDKSMSMRDQTMYCVS
jgi:hypothetical protein